LIKKAPPDEKKPGRRNLAERSTAGKRTSGQHEAQKKEDCGSADLSRKPHLFSAGGEKKEAPSLSAAEGEDTVSETKKKRGGRYQGKGKTFSKKPIYLHVQKANTSLWERTSWGVPKDPEKNAKATRTAKKEERRKTFRLTRPGFRRVRKGHPSSDLSEGE